MRGHVESYDDQAEQGVVRGEDGKAYAFSRSTVHDVQKIEVGLSLRFVSEHGSVLEAMPLDDAPANAKGWNEPPPQVEELDTRPELNPLQYWVKCFILYFYARGRATPSELVSFHLVNFIIFMGIMIAFASIGSGPAIPGWVALGCFVVTLPPTLSVTVRRLHDAGYSGWFVLIYFLPVFGWILLAFVLLLNPSQRHTNKYGRHPRASRGSAAAEA